MKNVGKDKGFRSGATAGDRGKVDRRAEERRLDRRVEADALP
jgi:hypothetical protein